jgi:DinB superfamily
MDTGEVISVLANTPIWLRRYLDALPEEAARRAPRRGEWSPAQILAHLRASDAILGPRIIRVLVRADSPLIGYDERAWAAISARAQLPLATQLTAFESQRAELVGVLRALKPDEWERAGLHEIRGRLTVAQIATDLAKHEQEHEAQMADAVQALQRSGHAP